MGLQEQFDPSSVMGTSKKAISGENADLAVILASGCPVQVGPNTAALTSLGSPEPGGAAHMAAEACVQPVHLDLWGEHEGGSCGGSASLQEPQRVLPQETETTSAASLLCA